MPCPFWSKEETNKETIEWEDIMRKGKKLEKGITHDLSNDEITTIVATIDAFGVNPNFLRQMIWDLTVARYKIYDWIAMLISCRHSGYGETPSELKQQEYVTRVMADAHMRAKDVHDFVRILREIDYYVTKPRKVKFWKVCRE